MENADGPSGVEVTIERASGVKSSPSRLSNLGCECLASVIPDGPRRARARARGPGGRSGARVPRPKKKGQQGGTWAPAPAQKGVGRGEHRKGGSGPRSLQPPSPPRRPPRPLDRVPPGNRREREQG